MYTFTAYKPRDILLAIEFDVKQKGFLSKLSNEILCVLPFIIPLSKSYPGEYYVILECKNSVSTPPKQLTIEETEKLILETNSDVDIGFHNKTTNKSYLFQIKRFGAYNNFKNNTQGLIKFLQKKVLDKKYSKSINILNIDIENSDGVNLHEIFEWASYIDWPFLICQFSYRSKDKYYFCQFWPTDNRGKYFEVSRYEIMKYLDFKKFF